MLFEKIWYAVFSVMISIEGLVFIYSKSLGVGFIANYSFALSNISISFSESPKYAKTSFFE